VRKQPEDKQNPLDCYEVLDDDLNIELPMYPFLVQLVLEVVAFQSNFLCDLRSLFTVCANSARNR